MVTRVGITSGAPASAAAFTPTLPTHAAGDRLLLYVGGKYNTTTVPTIDQSWILLGSGVGGTGTAGNDTGQTFWAVYAVDCTSSSMTAPTVTPGATAPNSWEWFCVSYRPTSGFAWRDALSTSWTWCTGGTDSSTASPLSGGTGSYSAGNQPTTGDALACFGTIPTDLGTALGATTITCNGLSGGTITTTGGYVENAFGNDTASVFADWTGWTGTTVAAPQLSFTVTGATNQSGSVATVALRDISTFAGPAIRGVFSAANSASTATTPLTGAQVGDTVLLLDWNNWYDLAGRPNPGGTAVAAWGSAVHTLDGGTNDVHLKVYVASVTTAGGTVITSPNSDEEIYHAIVVFVGAVQFDKAASTDTDVTTTSQVAPDPGTPAGANEVLVCTWVTHQTIINYTLPGGMTIIGAERDTSFNTGVGATENRTSASAPGTRTATASITGAYGSASVLIKSPAGAPDVAATPAVVAFTGVAGTIRSNLVATPGAVTLAGVAGAVRSNLVSTPAAVALTGVAGTVSVPPPVVAGTPGAVNFTGVAGVITPGVGATPGSVAFTGQAGTVRSNLAGTPGSIAFSGVSGAVRSNLVATPALVVFEGQAGSVSFPTPVVGTPGAVAFTGVAGVPRANLTGTPGAFAFAGVAGVARANINGTPGAFGFSGVGGSVRSNLVGAPGALAFTGVAGSGGPAIAGTPGALVFTGVAGVPRPVIAGTPAVLAFSGVPGALRVNLTGTPGVLAFSGVAGSSGLTVTCTPAALAFTGVPGVVRPVLVAAPGSLTFSGVSGAVTPKLTATPAVLTFSGVAGLRIVVGVPGALGFAGVAGVVRPNLLATPGVVVFEAVPGGVVGAIPNVVCTPAVLAFTGVSGPILVRLTGTPGLWSLTGAPGVPRPTLVGTPGALLLTGVPGGARPNLAGVPGELVFVGVAGVLEATKLYLLEVQLLPGRFGVGLESQRYRLIVPEGQVETELADQRYKIYQTWGRYDLSILDIEVP